MRKSAPFPVAAQAGSPVSSSSGPKIMVVISCTVGKGISTGWMDAIFFPSAKILLEILECVMCVSVLRAFALCRSAFQLHLRFAFLLVLFRLRVSIMQVSYKRMSPN